MALIEQSDLSVAWAQGSSLLFLDPVRLTCFFLVLLAIVVFANAALNGSQWQGYFPNKSNLDELCWG